MRTNVVIDDKLMEKALSTGYKTKRAAIEEGLRLLVQTKAQEGLKSLRGKIIWEGDLEQMRRD